MCSRSSLEKDKDKGWMEVDTRQEWQEIER